MSAAPRTHRRLGPAAASPQSVAEIVSLLPADFRRRDLLIENLHVLQDRFGGLHRRHLAALAEEMRLAPAEVQEVASFYAHFRLLGDDETAPKAVVRRCTGPACAMRPLDMNGLPEGVAVEDAPCMGLCDHAPAALAGKVPVRAADGGKVAAALASAQVTAASPAYDYPVLARCLSGELPRDEALAELDKAGLRGMGGAGFPTARKWRSVAAQAAPRLVVVNADEGEPGTFKDRWFLEHHAARVLEGTLVAAWAVEADEAYIYLRDEYADLHKALGEAIRRLPGGVTIHLRRGAGAYVCGEESALIESLEGKRGYPRQRPPYVAEVGLFGRPTLVNNVETLYWVSRILAEGAELFARAGRNGHQGFRTYSVSGRVSEPGVKIAPNGITITELIEEFCGGMEAGHRLSAYLPGGASGGFLPAHLTPPLAFGAIEEHGGFIGSAAVVVFSQADDLRAAALDLARFFAHESCGQCTPCRVGTAKSVDLLARPDWDRDLLHDLASVMRDASICGLGQAAPNVWQSLLRHFPEVAR
ncbi:NADH:ubiquinone oxidoreductase(Thioredoxin-like fold,16-181;NADH:ubiquinone oxidoreductase, 51kDa subunit,188-344;NADH ubiquinone oxidoreductase, F subunit, iron sulphur binding,453-498) [Magnetospirillum sp. XM-1]|uniref:NADH-ubiquinone oxidoreductase-F iron-sulfur binding region domain-containing protein n=1 Tax=Magnetospirillum sp. XM-1 TaxID=1663591 RepID=UPI00073DC06F|nr:NADH-ubiquinone oxidoreductase-F iron-sulfur binding region domain-containing protein [Magnetospirillum sp. XM-1]CUW38133.1 NADH:ubiquinone oxidoreductase(Thioredoxin-like fold,16-181;NADH:ubiquinone oxidoreductase, 51kDa subunit,188-344;NADH ubiquinone oxidoreductase, F subunit, iron sulphur binding,453-498) [Magnetospirillum sp. XM-1]